MKPLILHLMRCLLDALYPELGTPRSAASACPDKVEPALELPSFVVDAQRARLELDLEFDELYEEWSRYINDPAVIENTRTFLEHQWQR